MDIETWMSFTLASIILLIIPGPTILLVICYSASHGYRAKIPLIFGVALGHSTALGFSLPGIGMLMADSAFWLQTLRWIGGICLLYLGLKRLNAGFRLPYDVKNNGADSNWKLFLKIYSVTALNPKGIVFFVAFLPQFINASVNVTTQLWGLATTFVALATINSILYGVFACKARGTLSSPKTHRLYNLTGGSLLSVAGLWTLSAWQLSL